MAPRICSCRHSIGMHSDRAVTACEYLGCVCTGYRHDPDAVEDTSDPRPQRVTTMQQHPYLAMRAILAGAPVPTTPGTATTPQASTPEPPTPA